MITPRLTYHRSKEVSSGLHFACCQHLSNHIGSAALRASHIHGHPNLYLKSCHLSSSFLQTQNDHPISCQSPTPFPFPNLCSGSLKNCILTLCPMCLDGMWLPLKTPFPQLFQEELFPVLSQALAAGRERPSSPTSSSSFPNSSNLGASDTTSLVAVIW